MAKLSMHPPRRMSATDLSRLSFVVQALTSNPSRAKKMIEFVIGSHALLWKPRVGNDSPIFREALNAIANELDAKSTLKTVAKRLSARSGVGEKAAGYSLAWALSRRTPYRSTNSS